MSDRRNNAIRQTIAAGIALTGLLLFVAHCLGCGPSQAAKEKAAEATYAAEHLACVERFDTTAAINACREEVRQRWHITTTVAKDAGGGDR